VVENAGMAEFAQEYLAGAGVRLNAVRFGPADAPEAVVVLHGVFESWRTFAAYGPVLARADRTVRLLDLRGHGGSDRPERGYRFDDHAADVRAVLDGLAQHHRRVHLLGHSLGGVVALLVATAGHPALARTVLADPPVLLPGDWAGIHSMAERNRELARQPVETVRATMAANGGPGGRRDPQWYSMMAEALVGTAPGVFAALSAGGEQPVVDWSRHPAGEGTGRAVLVLAADERVPGAVLTGPRLDLLVTLLPDARFEVVAGAGHHIEVDRPAQFERLVLDFLGQAS
jgi:pimeloyl-ACP methyl ester carboxylesterase